MSREIKFRGKNSEGEWVYGGISPNKELIITFKFGIDLTRVDTKTVGQFTGVYDINGNEIYEGDILESAEKPDSFSFGFWEVEDKKSDYGFTGHCGQMKISGKPFRRVVKWHDERAACCLFLPLTNTIASSRPLKKCVTDDQMRVVGNVFDNPELLEAEKNERN